MESPSILIIDQQQVVCDSLALILVAEGFSCFTANDAREAQNVIAREDHVDMIIVDSQLLDRDGLFSFLQDKHPAIKIMLMSSYVEIEVTQKALMDGAHDFVLKPLDFQELIEKVNYHLRSVPR